MTMTTSASDSSDPSVADLLKRFEQDLLDAPDPAAVLERYRALHPELYETFRELADAIAMLQAAPFRRAVDGGDGRTEAPGPARFGPYRVVRSIGRGGMGEVYEAVEEPLGRRVAVKTVRRDEGQGASLLLRFDRERRTLARLHHTNIVPIYATGREDDLLFFAMPYIDGASLGQVVRTARSHATSGPGLNSSTFEDLLREAHSRSHASSKNPSCLGDAAPQEAAQEGLGSAPIDPPTAPMSAPSVVGPAEPRPSRAYVRAVARLMATVADGLHHAHLAGVVHRDLKPSNIMVDMGGHAWVLDFGLAALRGGGTAPGTSPTASELSPAGDDAEDLVTAGPLGTLPYMAPEQHRDARQADARSDVWGLGVTLYELLTLRRAFDSGESVLAADPIPPRRLDPGLDRDLEAIVLKALHKDPAGRYATAGELADDLSHWLGCEPVSARPAGFLRRFSLWARRRPGAASAVGIAAASLIAMAIVGIALGERHAAVAEAKALAADERERAKERELQLLAIQHLRLSKHLNGWANKHREDLRNLAGSRPDRELQSEAAAALAGLDAVRIKELRFGSDAPAVAFAPGNGRLLVSGADDRVRIWDRSTESMETSEPTGVGSFAFSPEGTMLQLAYPPGDRSSMVLRDVTRLRVLETFRSPIDGKQITAWAHTPDASFVGVASRKDDGAGAISIWSTRPGRQVKTIPADRVTDIALSPDGMTLAAGSDDGHVRLWALPDGRAIGTLPVGRARITTLQFGPDPRQREAEGGRGGHWLLAVGNAGGGVSVWDLHDRVPRSTMRGSQFEVLALAFSPDGMTLASCGRFEVRLWDLASGRHLLDCGPGNYLISLAFSADGRRLAVGRKAGFSHPGGVDVWELENGRGIRTFRGLDGHVEKLAISPDGNRLAALNHDWQVAVWDRRADRLLRVLDAPVGYFASSAVLAFSPDGRRLAVSAGHRATLWDVVTGAEVRSWELPEGLDGALVYPGEHRLLLARVETKGGGGPFEQVDDRKYPRVCVIRDLLGAGAAPPLAVITDASIYVHSIVLTPDGNACVLQGLGRTSDRRIRFIRVYETRNGRFLWDIPTQQPPDDLAGTMTLDPTGQFLATGLARNAHSTLFDLTTRQSLGLQVTQIGALAPGARRWLDGSSLRDLDRPEALITFLGDGGEGGSPRFTPDGRDICWCGPDGAVQIVRLAEVQERLAGLGLGW